MKSVVKPLLAIMLTSTMVLSAVAFTVDTSAEPEDPFSYADFYFMPLDDSTVSLLGYEGSDTVIDIPAEAISPTSHHYDVVEIGGTFDDSIAEVNIPDGIVRISNNAFTYATSLTTITVSNSNSYYQSDDGVLYTKGLHKLIQYPIGRDDGTYTVANATSEICVSAFQSSSLSTVTLPVNLLKISDSAFCDCKNLTSISFPSKLSIIEDSAFLGCTSLSNVVFPDDLDMIGSYAFCYTAISEINIPYGVEYIGDYAFSCCENLQVFTSDNYRFPALNGILYEESEKNEKILCYPAGKTDTEFTVPEKTDIKFGAFYGCVNLKSVSFPKGYNSVPIGALYGCHSLETVDLKNITVIEMYAFYECLSLKTIENNQDLIFIGTLAFYDCGLTEVHIPSKVTVVESMAFSYCRSLQEAVIDESCKASIESYVFDGDAELKTIRVNSSDVVFEENSLVISEDEDLKAHVDIFVPSGYDIPSDASNEFTILNVIREGERPYPWENWIGVFFCALVIIGILYGMREV